LWLARGYSTRTTTRASIGVDRPPPLPRGPRQRHSLVSRPPAGREVQGAGVFHEACYEIWWEDSSTRHIDGKYRAHVEG